MELSHFFSPVSPERNPKRYPSKFDNIESYTQIYTLNQNFPDWKKSDIVLIGATEERGGFGLPGTGDAADKIREYFYQYVCPQGTLKISDLGNLDLKEDIEDYYFNLTYIAEQILKYDKILILMGGTQELSYCLYRAFEKFESPLEYVSIDSCLDIFDSEPGLNSASFNHKILINGTEYLDHFSVLGVQSYLVSQEEKDIFKKLHLEYLRIGELRSNLRSAEMYLRQASLISFDMSAVRKSDAPGSTHGTPAGFSVEEACQIARYAGMGYNSSCIHFSEINPQTDISDQTCQLAALLIWYYIDGIYSRPSDRPKADRSNLIRYRVALHGAIKEVIFYKHELTDRWWMEVPSPAALAKKSGKTYLIPCSEKDYQLALADEIPERWWIFHGKYEQI